MKFVEEYLSKHHLLHAPHKWFFAFISSPIHYLEMHYKKKYHLKFMHARKLFIFDVTLLFSMIILLAGSLSWLMYDPSVTDLVYLSVRPTHERILSGEYTTYTINYRNDSNTTLNSPVLDVILPQNFIIDSVIPEDLFDFDNNIFTLKNIKPTYGGQFSISGWFYGTPDIENPLLATLSYTQEGRKKQEQKISPHISILRGSVLEMNIELADKITNNISLPITLDIINNGDIDLNNIKIPLLFPTGVTLSDPKTLKGLVEDNSWYIEKLKPEESTKLNGILHVNLPSKQEILELNITPTVDINNQAISQKTSSHEFNIVYPHLEIQTSWNNEIDFARPNEIPVLSLQIRYDSNVSLSNLTLDIPLPTSIINTTKFINLNGGSLSNNVVTISQKNIPDLSQINPGGLVNLSLLVPIKYSPTGGTDLELFLSPTISGNVPGLSKALYETSTDSSRIAIGTQLLFNTELRYYTNEGDQLGRGPLPLQVGKETKYWAMAQITNSTSRADNIVFSAKLPNYVSWTGKTSVTHGAQISFNSANRRVSWSLSSLPEHTTAGVYFELAITPISSRIGTSPILLENISISGQDGYIGVPIAHSSTNLDTSIPTDTIGKQKGVIVH